MSNDDKQQTPGYREENPKPSSGSGQKVPGEGHPKESQNMPKDKPGKQGS